MMRPTVSKPISGRRVHDPVRRRGWVQAEGKDTPYLGEGFKKTVPDDEETAKCRSGRIMEPPLEMVIRRVCPCTLHPPPPTLPADVVFSTVTRFIAGSFRTSTLIRYILRGYFNINEGTPVNKSFPG